MSPPARLLDDVRAFVGHDLDVNGHGDERVHLYARILSALEAAERLVGVWRATGEAVDRRLAASWSELDALPSATDFIIPEQEARRALEAAFSPNVAPTDGVKPTA